MPPDRSVLSNSNSRSPKIDSYHLYPSISYQFNDDIVILVIRPDKKGINYATFLYFHFNRVSNYRLIPLTSIRGGSSMMLDWNKSFTS